jgi:hypothetical protein
VWLVSAFWFAALSASQSSPPDPPCPPTPWAVTESSDSEAVVLLVEPTYHLLVEPQGPAASPPIRPGRWQAPGAPAAPSEVTVVGEAGQWVPGSLVAVEWLCVDDCSAGIPVCAWTARYKTMGRDWPAVAVVPGRVALQPVAAAGAERTVSLDDIDPKAKSVQFDSPHDPDPETQRYWAEQSACTALGVGPFERVVCPRANVAYLRAGGTIVERAWEDYGEVKLGVLGRSGEGPGEAFLVRTSGKFSLSTSWVHRRGQAWHRDRGPSNRLGGGICDGDPEIAVLNPHTERADPPLNDAARPLWYGLFDKGGHTTVVMTRWDGEPLDHGWETARLLLLARGLHGLSEGPLATARFDERCADAARGAAWGAEPRACELTHRDERRGDVRYVLATRPAAPPFALGPTGAPQLSLSIAEPQSPRLEQEVLLTAPPELVSQLRVLFVGELTGDGELDLVLEAPRVEQPQQRRVWLFASSRGGVNTGRWRLAATYDVPVR